MMVLTGGLWAGWVFVRGQKATAVSSLAAKYIVENVG
jgi:hypothetical protein